LSRLRLTLLALVAFSVLAVAGTWPLAAGLSSRVPHDPGDPVLNTWILWWNSQAVPLTGAWWDAPFFVPLPGALGLSEHLLGISVLTTPLQLAGTGPLTAYNAAVLVSYALSGFFAFLLVMRLTGSAIAAAAAGLAFAFAPYRAGQLAHIQVLTAQWMPAMLLGMHGYVATRRARWLLLFGGAWLLQATSNGYYMLFVPVLIALWIAWFTDWRQSPRMSAALLATWVAASLPLAPLLLKYREIHEGLGLGRSLADIRQFSATFDSFLYAPPMLALWPAGDNAASAEDWLFPGLTVVVLAAGGVAALARTRQLRDAFRRRSPLLFYTAAALFMFLLASGPGGDGADPPSLLRPYSWLLWLPGYDSLRVPARFAMLGALCLAVAAGLAMSMLLRGATRLRTAVACLALAGIAADGVMQPMPLVAPPQRVMLGEIGDANVIEIPPTDATLNAGAMYRSIFHRRPLINGYSGYTPYHYSILSLAIWRGDTSVLTYLARERPLAIVVNQATDPAGDFQRMIAKIPGIQGPNVSGVGSTFLLPLQPPAAPHLRGAPLPAQLTLDGRSVVADLGQPRSVGALDFPLRARYMDLAGRVAIEASDDGREWRRVWLGWTGEFALDAALIDPAIAPVRIPFPAVHTRFLRIYPAESWLKDELRIIG
jgi:hypothetical protein